jgi:peroxiredoxin
LVHILFFLEFNKLDLKTFSTFNNLIFYHAGATLIGVSSDSVESHKNFEKKFNLVQRMVSDKDSGLRKTWGVPDGP